MRSLRFLGLFLLPAALVAVGCGEQNSPTDPGTAALADGAGGELTANTANPVAFSARGSGHYQGPGIGGSEVGLRTFSVTAIQRQDGTTTGTLQYQTHDQGDPQVTHKQHGRVFCMVDLGNGVAAIGAEGTLRQPDDTPPSPSAIGLPLPDADRPNGNHGLIFSVRDNGEGPNASPDEVTGVIHTTEGAVAFACANPTLVFGPRPDLVAEAFFNDIQAGNIQVTFP
jgi:hypothetical protein